MLAVDDDDGGGDAGVESPMATYLNLTTHQLVRETEAGSTCADKWLALYSGLQKNIFDGLDNGTLAAIEQSLQKRLGRRAVPPPRRRGICCPPRDRLACTAVSSTTSTLRARRTAGTGWRRCWSERLVYYGLRCDCAACLGSLGSPGAYPLEAGSRWSRGGQQCRRAKNGT